MLTSDFHCKFTCCLKKNAKKVLRKSAIDEQQTENTEQKVKKVSAVSADTQQSDNTERPFIFSKAKWAKKYKIDNRLLPW